MPINCWQLGISSASADFPAAGACYIAAWPALNACILPLSASPRPQMAWPSNQPLSHCLQPGQSAPEMAAAAAAAAVVREAAANAVMEVLDAGESEEEKTTKLAMAKEDKMRKVIRYAANRFHQFSCGDKKPGMHGLPACLMHHSGTWEAVHCLFWFVPLICSTCAQLPVCKQASVLQMLLEQPKLSSNDHMWKHTQLRICKPGP